MLADPGWSLSLLLAFVQISGPAYTFVPQFLQPAEMNSESGNVRLAWRSGPQPAVFEVQQARSAAFQNARTIYRGPDLATFVSGLTDGVYYFRVHVQGGQWSKPVKLNVQHHSLSLALTLFSLGAVVFLLTVVVILRGVRDGTVSER